MSERSTEPTAREALRHVLDPRLTRRQLLTGVAAAGAATWLGGALAGQPAQAAPGTVLESGGRTLFTRFTAIAPSAADALEVADGFVAEVLIRWGDEFGEGLRFGYNCDYTDYFPLRGHGGHSGHGGQSGFGGREGLLWVNHEYVIPYFTTDWRSSADPTWDPRVEPFRTLMAREKSEVGGSIVHVRQSPHGRWSVVGGSPYGRRFTAAGPLVPYDGPAAGSGLVPDEGVLGTLANCSGGHTPWGTVLSGEENYQSYGLKRSMPFALGWDRSGDPNYYVGEPGLNAYGATATEKPYYGYICEVDPYTGEAVKHTALGRLHHENVGLRIARDGRVVAYTGDDAPAADGMLFKFVSSRRWWPGMPRTAALRLLSEGQLYVGQFLPSSDPVGAQSGTGFWHPVRMVPEAMAFTTQWVRDNVVAQVGGVLNQFQVPRAEDVECVPGRPRDVLFTLTSAQGWKAGPTRYGVVRHLREASESPDSTSFTWTNVVQGGEADSGLASPDNLAFSGRDHLWVASDISTSSLNVPGRGFEWHGNNALFYVPLRGSDAGIAYRFANAPVAAEFTGPTFVDERRTLFLSVQHPGESTPLNAPISTDAYTSWWPAGNRTAGTGTPSKPRPSVVTIRPER